MIRNVVVNNHHLVYADINNINLPKSLEKFEQFIRAKQINAGNLEAMFMNWLKNERKPSQSSTQKRQEYPKNPATKPSTYKFFHELQAKGSIMTNKISQNRTEEEKKIAFDSIQQCMDILKPKIKPNTPIDLQNLNPNTSIQYPLNEK